eukprot:4479775-Pyramimonas_sp.AAC.1
MGATCARAPTQPSSPASSSTTCPRASWTCTRKTSRSLQVANGRGSGRGRRPTRWSLSYAPAAATRTRPCSTASGRALRIGGARSTTPPAT